MDYLYILLLISIISFFFGCFLMYFIFNSKINKKYIELQELQDIKNISNAQEEFIKGSYLEKLIYNELEAIPCYKKILNNIYISKGEGRTFQIDLLFVTYSGIYVIESKDYSGTIYGNEKYKNWIQFYNNGSKKEFYNPIIQNKYHIKYLANILKINFNYLKSIIVFGDSTTIKFLDYNVEESKVLNLLNLRSYLLTKINNKLLEKEEIDRIYNILEKYTKPSNNIINKHINYVEKCKLN